MPATRSSWTPWAMSRSSLPVVHLEDCRRPGLRGNVPLLVSRLGVAPMRTHYHVEQDGQLVGDRQPRRRTAWTMAIRLSKERPEARWRVVLCDGGVFGRNRPGCRTTTWRSAGPKNVGVEWCHFQFPYIYLYARKVLSHTHHTSNRCPFNDAAGGRSMLHLEGPTPSPTAPFLTHFPGRPMPPAPKNAGVKWCHFSFSINIYTRVRC